MKPKKIKKEGEIRTNIPAIQNLPDEDDAEEENIEEEEY
jgi:hypothetical protein